MKKAIAILLCTALLLSLTCFSASASVHYSFYQYGDVDLDGTQDIIDITVLQRHLSNSDSVRLIAEKRAVEDLEKQHIITRYDELFEQYTERYYLVMLEAADFDHSGDADVLDVTAMQRSLVGFAVSEEYGGEFHNDCSINNFYASYASGKAMTGEPVTFTALVTSSTEIVDYTFSVDGVEVQRSGDNTFTYTFDETDRYYFIEIAARNVIGCTASQYLNYRVTEPYDIVTKPVVNNYYYDGAHCTSGRHMLTVGAVGGTAPYRYTFRIDLNGTENPVQYADLKGFRYAAETTPDGTITATYIIQDTPGTNVAYLPNNLFNEYLFYGGLNGTFNLNNQYEIIVQAIDADGVQSKPVAIPYQYVLYYG